MRCNRTTSAFRKERNIRRMNYAGRSVRVLTSILPDDKGNESYLEHALFKRIFDAQGSARENLEQAKIRSKRYYDYKTNPQVFNKDDYVFC